MTESHPQHNTGDDGSLSASQSAHEEALPVVADQLGSSIMMADEDPTTCLLVKGDLVRVSEEGRLAERRLKDRFGCLGRIAKFENDLYDVEWVVDGGGAHGVRREYIIRSCGDQDGNETRRKRKQPKSFMNEKILSSSDAAKQRKSQQEASMSNSEAKIPAAKMSVKKLSSVKNGSKATKKLPVANGKKKSYSKSEDKATTKKSKVEPKATGIKRKLTGPAKTTASDKKPKVEDESASKALEMFERHRRDFERCLERLEKVDKFGFFLDDTPPEWDENYFPKTIEANKAISESNSVAAETGRSCNEVEGELSKVINDDEKESAGCSAKKKSKTKKSQTAPSPTFPAHPPFNWAMVRRRMENGRYFIDRERAEEDNRFHVLKLYYASLPVDRRPRKRQQKGRANSRVLHKMGVDWDCFLSDIQAMCDAALDRDMDSSEEGKGTLSFAVEKIKDATRQYCEQRGTRQVAEMQLADDVHKFYAAIESTENKEAAMQSWRKEPFPERHYEKLKNDVICAGLSELDERTASHELRTNLPDSFVGLSYRYDDTGQSEAWMKSVVDETESTKKKDDKARQAALALAADEGVVRAQVNATMNSLLIGVQDRVMTETGVLKQPELRSANWLRAQPEELTGRIEDRTSDIAESVDCSSEIVKDNFCSPEVIEQPVWGIDCYTRRNITACLETEFDTTTALEFVEKWLLPAINACPGYLGHDIGNACRVLSGLPIEFAHDSREVQEQESLARQDRQNILREALQQKIKSAAPVWLKAAAGELYRARLALGPDFFRAHPKGHGSILLCSRVEANTLVTFYRGEVYPGWRWGEKMDAIDITQQRKNLKPALPDFYNMALERPQSDPRGYGLLIVDASRKAGHGSSVSHSCAPTCEVRVTALNGELCLAMTTIRELEMGEELTFDYNAVTESLVEYSSAVCLCGYGKCRGSFLHYATADCYQQVLNRNAPLASRFSNLVKASMKRVMADDDDRILQSHGFQTAAFGAISINRRQQSTSEGRDSLIDSMDFVPVWLRTYIADTLRYIEYERRALPIALICDHLVTKRSGSSLVTVETEIANTEKEPSRPEPAFFYFVRTSEKFLLSLIEKEGGETNVTGMRKQHALNKVGAAYWNELSEDKKQVFKDQAWAEFEKKKKAWRSEKGKVKKTGKGKNAKKDTKIKSKGKSKPDISDILHSSSVSFQDADAEGISTMEQRIQQLTQTLSRVGRVLDRHRESLIEHEVSYDLDTSALDASSLQNLVQSPISVLTDVAVVGWLWSSPSGPVTDLMAKMSSMQCLRDEFQQKVVSLKAKYSKLDSFGDPATKLIDSQPQQVMSSAEGRRLVTKALLELRTIILREFKEMGRLHKKYKTLLRDAPIENDAGTLEDTSEMNDKVIDATLDQDDDTDTTFVEAEVADRGSPGGTCTSLTSVTSESTQRVIVAVMKHVVDGVECQAVESNEADANMVDQSETEVSPESESQSPISAASFLEANPWLGHFHERLAMLAAADLLLFYAHTKNFFVMNPYSSLTSTPVEVYARELGNTVPRTAMDVDSQPMQETTSSAAELNATANNDGGRTPSQDHVMSGTMDLVGTKNHKITQETDTEICNPADTVAKVTVSYNGDYVVSQLLQWYNGGFGQKPGLPNIYGCMLLPALSGCWSSDMLKQNKAKTDRKSYYESKVRPRMVEWLQDPFQRGNPWPEEVHKAFLNGENDILKGDTSSVWLPIGSPVVDFLVTGDESSISDVLLELDADDKVSSKTGTGGLLASVDKGRPAQAVCSWVQCENPDCNKWRKIPWHVDIDLLPEKFYCKDNKWNPAVADCDIPEDGWDEDDKLVGQDGKVEGSPVRKIKNASLSPSEEANFYVGARFDVQRTGRTNYCVGAVTKFDFSGNTKRIMFHFQHTTSNADEWIEFGSPRIAPLYSQVSKPKKQIKGEPSKPMDMKDEVPKPEDVPKSTVADCDVPKEGRGNDDKPVVRDGKVKGSSIRKIKHVSLSPSEAANFTIGARFDVQRTGRTKYSVSEVTNLDFSGDTKRIKFHFHHTPSSADEWIEFGSPRIAALHSKVSKTKKQAKGEPPKPGEVPKENELLDKEASASADNPIDSNKKETKPTKVASAPTLDGPALVQDISSEITPSPKNGDSMFESKMPEKRMEPQGGLTSGVEKKPKRARKPKQKAVRAPAVAGPVEMRPAAGFQIDGAAAYQALSLDALNRYKSQVSTNTFSHMGLSPYHFNQSSYNPFNHAGSIPFPFGGPANDPRSLGILDAFVSSTFASGGLPPQWPHMNMDHRFPQTGNMAGHAATIASPLPPHAVASAHASRPPGSPLDLLTHAAMMRSDKEEWNSQHAQGPNR